MTNQLPRRAAAALILALPLFVACKTGKGAAGAGEQTGMQSQSLPPDTTSTAPNPSGATGDTARGPAGPTGTLSDANIMALLDEANKADSSAGAVAAKKATSADVKAFAREMTIDHHKLREAGAKLAKQLKITPEPPANDPLAPAVQDETNALESTPKGPDFDRTYIEKEVSAHQAVKDLLDQAHRATQNAEIQKLIEKATPIVQQHLDHAQNLQKKLTKTA
jgi:putative membrane protein